MEYQAQAKYLHCSPRKVRLVADAIRKLSLSAALAQLAVWPKAAAGPVREIIASAIANAKQTGASDEKLRFKSIEVMGGPVMKRWQAVSRGMAHAYKKRMTHIKIVLTD